MSNKANAILLAVLVLASVVLALAGFEVGLFVLLMVAGGALGTTLVYFATRSHRTRKPVALLVLSGVLALFLVSIFGLASGREWLAIAPSIHELPSGPLFFGLIIGVMQTALGRLVGRGAWAGD
ncbi:MAG: hypothetical protein M3P49_14235 [Actinomycetota bacterium]|nr:hypothetical protein [Actinomycetota bacterium]